jgi:uncharacterized membrane protein HdeD (DUF308 family)
MPLSDVAAAFASTVRKAEPASTFRPSVITAMPRRKKPNPPAMAIVVSKVSRRSEDRDFARQFCAGGSGDYHLFRPFYPKLEWQRNRALPDFPDPAHTGGTDVSTNYTGRAERRHTAEAIRDNWLLFVLLGAVLALSGAAAILMPAVSEIPASKILGTVLVISGLLQIVQSSKMVHWTGFAWHILLGALATVGGALIYTDPFAGVVAITLLIAVILAIHGLTQIAFAVRVRNQQGWHWFLISGCVALVVSALLLAKLPYTHSFTPATLAGVSLLSAGCAYIAMALASRKASRTSP